MKSRSRLAHISLAGGEKRGPMRRAIARRKKRVAARANYTPLMAYGPASPNDTRNLTFFKHFRNSIHIEIKFQEQNKKGKVAAFQTPARAQRRGRPRASGAQLPRRSHAGGRHIERLGLLALHAAGLVRVGPLTTAIISAVMRSGTDVHT
ncbi:hypothetical protein EVAR_33316_1 [Eumeta japonica]|uniref:Uncharacterized protein n=1 Tax=Eumeta variegata TaxID=151549 RepID=A0A4C1WGQ2_EUMVA|nr:hypothetical protein EVAR_33316_1 [Eumeta japonica]